MKIAKTCCLKTQILHQYPVTSCYFNLHGGRQFAHQFVSPSHATVEAKELNPQTVGLLGPENAKAQLVIGCRVRFPSFSLKAHFISTSGPNLSVEKREVLRDDFRKSSRRCPCRFVHRRFSILAQWSSSRIQSWSIPALFLSLAQVSKIQLRTLNPSSSVQNMGKVRAPSPKSCKPFCPGLKSTGVPNQDMGTSGTVKRNGTNALTITDHY